MTQTELTQTELTQALSKFAKADLRAARKNGEMMENNGGPRSFKTWLDRVRRKVEEVVNRSGGGYSGGQSAHVGGR